MSDNDDAHDPSVGVRRRHLPNFVGEGAPLEWRAPGNERQYDFGLDRSRPPTRGSGSRVLSGCCAAARAIGNT